MSRINVFAPKDMPNLAEELRDNFSSEDELNDYLETYFPDEVLSCLSIETEEIINEVNENSDLRDLFRTYGF